MVTDEMLKRAIEAYAKETGAEDWQLDGWINSAIRAALEAALSAAEPVARQYRAGSPEGETSWRMVDDEHYAGWEAMKKRFPDSVTLQYRDLYAAATPALSAQVQDVAEGWHVASNSSSVLIYSLKQDGWRKGEPVMVNDIMIRVENANRSSNELQPIVDAIMRALPAAPAKQEG
ncbi:hypothetical protein [Agrobacterium sp. ST15.13.015]|uniref:hypothetical protein n=1 Tax=Agrobacterium sp. ST15.13.015 TaxID=3017319 RepID=UPI0022C2CE82|nr:hypothetical protein [Agrobacterium sp. ST15.13.015]MCZ7501980.1 hypothetical protein [Rhizobium rhizogenes]